MRAFMILIIHHTGIPPYENISGDVPFLRR